MLTKLKAYYKWLVSAVGAVLIVLNEVLPVLNGDVKNYVTIGIAVLTSLSVFLVKNEPVVEGQP